MERYWYCKLGTEGLKVPRKRVPTTSTAVTSIARAKEMGVSAARRGRRLHDCNYREQSMIDAWEQGYREEKARGKA